MEADLATQTSAAMYEETERHIRDLEDSAMDISPDQCENWTPECEGDIKPYVGQIFETVQQGVDFYKRYASVVGFDVRCSTMRKTSDGDVGVKYLLCSREGKTARAGERISNVNVEQNPPSQKRRRVSNRTGCKAQLALKRTKHGLYAINILEERHNHRLSSDTAKPFLKVNRKLNIGHQAFMAICARANIGPSKAFRLYKELVGDFTNIGATSIEFRNCRRDLHAYLADSDAQAIIDKYHTKQEIAPGMKFEYAADEQNHLTMIFWADPTARKNYASFGDVFSFDATYQTNRYNLVFVPFTGVDNHKKSITFGAGLISKEDVPSYVWLLEAFKRAMGHMPQVFITDQDPAIKIAVAQVYPSTRHRYCMWHILAKVGEKVGTNLAKDETFRKALNSVVWNETLGVNEFERRWKAVMKDYGLEEHHWLSHVYEIRANWIEAYFSNVFMGGLLRTTSRSEAENGVFGCFTNHNATLLEFFTQFEGAIDLQRYKQARLVAECEGCFPSTKTPLAIERHAAAVYTVTIFYEVQTEIYEACFSCHIKGKEPSEDHNLYYVEDGGCGQHTVRYNKDDGTLDCSCKKFDRVGILCRHIFVVLKDNKAECIPLRYIVGRWTRDANGCTMHEIDDVDDITLANEAEDKTIVAQVINEFYSCMALSRGQTTEMQGLLALLQQHKAKVLNERMEKQGTTTRDALLEIFYGTPVSSKVTILPPKIAKNKGSGKRLKSTKEKAIEKNAKPKRMCRTCNQLAHHDSRNCPAS